ncbi:MAG: glycosyltransferase [Candidatus Ornithospirochaeta sp.]
MSEAAKNRIKILHVGLDSRLGGIETYLLKIASHIDASRFQFDFLAFNGIEPCFYKELSSLGCGFKFVRGRRDNFFGNAKDVRELMEREKYDIVHCHLNSLSYITPALEGLKSGAKVIIHSRNGGAAPGSSSRIFCFINKYLLPYDKMTLFAVSDKAGEWMFGKKREFLVLNNGIEADKFSFSEEKRASCRKELGIGEDKDVVLNVGAFRAQKNHSFIIDIFKRYAEKKPDSILVLVGDGELLSSIKDKVKEEGIEDKVMFLGKRLDLDRILSASDRFLFPSLYEGFPNALLEAEASGLLCVTSDVITEEACLEGSIRVSLDAPVDNWVEALSSPLLPDRERFVTVVNQNGFGVEREISRLEELYEDLMGVESSGKVYSHRIS